MAEMLDFSHHQPQGGGIGVWMPATNTEKWS